MLAISTRLLRTVRFFNGGELSTRYFHYDGIHLTASGTKRLLDALNRAFQILAPRELRFTPDLSNRDASV